MRRWRRAVALALYAAGCAMPALGQRDGGSAFSGHALAVASVAAPGKAQDVLRELVDPYTGVHWLLLRDPAHAGGPGRLVLVPGRRGASGGSSHGSLAMRGTELVIHAGDALVVEEHTAVLDARLEAVALNSASTGQSLSARLKAGGKVVQVVAEGRGRAVFATNHGERR